MENVRGQNQDRNKHPEKDHSTERGNRDALRQDQSQDQSNNRDRNSKKDEHVSNPSTHRTQRQEGMEGRKESDVIR